MTNFNTYFKAELQKTATSKAFKNTLIIIAVLCIFLAAIFGMVSDIWEQLYPQLLQGVHFSSNQEAIAYLEQSIEEYTNTSLGISDNTLDQLRSMLAKYKYLDSHGLDTTMVTDFTSPNGVGAMMLSLFCSIAFSIFCIYSIIACATNLRGEEKDGTLKQQLIGPIDRNGLFSAKWLSVFVMSAIGITLVFIVSSVYTAIAYDLSSLRELIVINQSIVTTVSPFVSTLITYLYYLIVLYVIGQFTYFISNLTNVRGNPAILPLIIYLFGDVIENLLSYIYIGYAGFFQNLYFLRGLSVTGYDFQGVNLFTSLAFTTVYTTLMTVFNYRFFKTRDIN